MWKRKRKGAKWVLWSVLAEQKEPALISRKARRRFIKIRIYRQDSRKDFAEPTCWPRQKYEPLASTPCRVAAIQRCHALPIRGRPRLGHGYSKIKFHHAKDATEEWAAIRYKIPRELFLLGLPLQGETLSQLITGCIEPPDETRFVVIYIHEISVFFFVFFLLYRVIHATGSSCRSRLIAIRKKF